MSMQACVVCVTIFSTGGKLPVSCVQSYTLLLRCPFFIVHLIKLQHTHTQSHTHTQVQTILPTVSVAHLPRGYSTSRSTNISFALWRSPDAWTRNALACRCSLSVILLSSDDSRLTASVWTETEGKPFVYNRDIVNLTSVLFPGRKQSKHKYRNRNIVGCPQKQKIVGPHNYMQCCSLTMLLNIHPL